MTEISKASIFSNNELITELDYPKLKLSDGKIHIDCFLIKKNHGFENDNLFYNDLHEKFKSPQLEIKAYSKQGSDIVIKEIYLASSTYPTFEFTFACQDHYIEYILCDENKRIEDFYLSSFLVEGIDILFTKTSEVYKKRFLFGIDDSRVLSFSLDHSELYFHFATKKRQYDLKIGIIEKSDSQKSIVIKFFGANQLPYRVYKIIKNSIKYFISYLAGNNIIIREEHFTINHQYYIAKKYSKHNLNSIKKNNFLPIFDPQFRHDDIVQDYLKTLTAYLFVDQSLNISEVIYLVNQSKHVNIESSFFILLIAIEKLSNNLIKSNLLEQKDNFVIDNELFKKFKPDLIKRLSETFSGEITNKEINLFKTKIGNLNIKSSTDNKIDLLLNFCDIARSEDIDALFPKLRNLAIHEGEISFSEDDVYKNYHTLFILINTIICNLIQYKGVRFIKQKNQKNYISKIEEFKVDYKNYS